MTKTLWSLRWSVAHGKHYRAERNVSDDTADAWLAIFRRDEPTISFVISVRKPRLKH